MPISERKQVLGVGAQISSLVSEVSEPTQDMPGETMHGSIADLTITGSGSQAAPTNISVPVITGTAQVGQTLSVTTGVWEDQHAPISAYAYQWKDDGVAISGATGPTRLLAVGEQGGVITCTVTATNAKGSTSATSAGTAAVIAA